jgi:glucose-6-phosphate 1-dehydrogenase
VVEPALRDREPVEAYEPGSWGPPSAAAIVAGGEGWHDPQPEAGDPC